MPASPAIRAALEGDVQFTMCGAAAQEILERLSEEETILMSGVAHVGDDLGYYVLTERGIHYTDREKAGLFKKRHVSGFIDRDAIEEAYVERFPKSPEYAYLRLQGATGRVGTVWFEDAFCRGSAGDYAERMAGLLVSG